MGRNSVVELTAAAAAANEPGFVTAARIRAGGVDPLGLRQLNFDLMDEVLPGVNNVARHVRPFVVMAWAWRRALQLAEATDSTHIKISALQDFVDRIEVLFVLSQMLLNSDVDLPGREYLAPWLMKTNLTFGGSMWKKCREDRADSTALSAPINYGPGLKMFGWVEVHPDHSEVMVPTPGASHALASLEAALRPALKHDAFSRFGTVTVTRKELERWSELWALDRVTSAEAEVMSNLLMGTAALPERRLGVNLLLAAAVYERSTDVAVVRAAMSGPPARFTPPRELQPIRDVWRTVQVRQLFRLSLESLLYWMMLKLEERQPRSVQMLVDTFLDSLPTTGTTTAGDWIRSLRSDELGPTELIDRIEQACDVAGHEDLPHSVIQGLAFCLTEPTAAGSHIQRAERLPLMRAQTEFAARAHASVTALVRHVLESWVLAQHAYWSVGRGLADARAGGSPLLRLRVILDEGGWMLAPGAYGARAPRPTPDRLETAISLATECRLLERARL
jgi:hypothetical protein